ncbi:MAG TPA: polysaccharide deacetylase family protein [Gemmatimonadaceae bacterium]|nr:polysaccharide deacetylase family protein [Gemmatimonadaceae bacterium]
MLSALYYAGLEEIGATTFVRRARSGAVVLAYHNVVPDAGGVGDPGLHLPLAQFERQVEWLRARYAIVPLAELAERVRDGRTVRGLAAVTFDDAYEGVFQHAWPLLRARGIAATVFVPTALVGQRSAFWWDHPETVRRATPVQRERWLREQRGDAAAILATVNGGEGAVLPAVLRPASWTTIARAVGTGLSVGAHSCTHRTLTRLGDAELDAEVRESRDVLRARTGADVTAFAYPYGISDARVRDAVRRAGYACAVTLGYGHNAGGTDPFAMRRVNVPAAISAAAFAAWTAGLRPRLGRAS